MKPFKQSTIIPIVLVILILFSCDSRSITGIAKDDRPPNGVLVTGTEGIEFSGSVTYNMNDGTASIADLATLEVPYSMEFGPDVERAEVDIFKKNGSGRLILSLVEYGEIVAVVETERSDEPITVVYDLKTSH